MDMPFASKMSRGDTPPQMCNIGPGQKITWIRAPLAASFVPCGIRVKRKGDEVIVADEDWEQNPPTKLTEVDFTVATQMLDEGGYYKDAENCLNPEPMDTTDSQVHVGTEAQASLGAQQQHNSYQGVYFAEAQSGAVRVMPRKTKTAKRHISNIPIIQQPAACSYFGFGPPPPPRNEQF